MARRGRGGAQPVEKLDEEALLLQLVVEAGDAQGHKGNAEKAYNAKREQLAAMYGRLRKTGDAVIAGKYQAVIDHDEESYVDPEALFKLLKDDRKSFFALVKVGLEAAKAVLTPEAYSALERKRKKAKPTLRITLAKKKGDAEAPPPSAA